MLPPISTRVPKEVHMSRLTPTNMCPGNPCSIFSVHAASNTSVFRATTSDATLGGTFIHRDIRLCSVAACVRRSLAVCAVVCGGKSRRKRRKK